MTEEKRSHPNPDTTPQPRGCRRFWPSMLALSAALALAGCHFIKASTSFETSFGSPAAESTPATSEADPSGQGATPSAKEGIAADCTFKGKKLYGKVKIVDSFPDLKVKVVTSFADLKVKKVSSLANKCGKWKLVESFPDLKIKLVTSFPDLKIKYVDAFPGLP